MPPKNSVNPELDEVLARPENRCCADCGAKAPRWASVNLGVLVCIDCSGTHRSLGVHISVVKSVTLDKWQPKWIATVSKIGNRIANSYYLSRLPRDYEAPRESDSRDKLNLWIRNKYERKDYAPRNQPSPAELLAQGRNPDVYDGAGDDDYDSRNNGRRGARDRSDSDDRHQSNNRRSETRRDERPRQRERTPEEKWDDRSRASKVSAPTPAPAPKTSDVVDLLGFDSAPVSAPPTSTPQPLAQSQNVGAVDFFAFQNAAAPTPDLNLIPTPSPVPATPAPEQIQNEKVDFMKNSLASLYNQPATDNRFSAFGPGPGMGAGFGCGCNGMMQQQNMNTGLHQLQGLQPPYNQQPQGYSALFNQQTQGFPSGCNGCGGCNGYGCGGCSCSGCGCNGFSGCGGCGCGGCGGCSCGGCGCGNGMMQQPMNQGLHQMQGMGFGAQMPGSACNATGFTYAGFR
jgi:hypothetical protein